MKKAFKIKGDIMTWEYIIKRKNIGWRKNIMRELLDKYDKLVATPNLDEKVDKDNRFLTDTLEEIIKLCQEDIADIKEISRSRRD